MMKILSEMRKKIIDYFEMNKSRLPQDLIEKFCNWKQSFNSNFIII